MERRALALLTLLVLVASTGCLGAALGDTLEMSASPAAVDDGATEDAAFSQSDYRIEYLEETVEIGTTQRRVNATNHVVVYNRTAELRRYDGDTAVVVVAATPDFTVFGQSMNPAAEMSHRELIEEFRSDIEAEVGPIGELSLDSHRTEPVLGRAANVTTFETDSTVEGEDVTLELHVTTVHHEGDLIVAIGGHPETLQHQAPAVHAMFRGIEHPVSVATLQRT